MELEKIISYQVNRCAFVLRQTFFDFMRGKGIEFTPEEGIILLQLWEEDRQTQSELGRFVYKGPSTLSRQLDSLVAKGFVFREICAEDRRKTYVCLTEEGKAAKDFLFKHALDFMVLVCDDVTEKDLSHAMATLAKIRENALTYRKTDRRIERIA